MKVDEALAEAVDQHVSQWRADALAEDPRTQHWTNRDLARRLTAAGYPIAHPQVHRLRTGQRKVSVSEWLHIALVLSVPPAALLRGVDDADAVVDWIAGRRPLAAVDEPARFYAAPLTGSEASGTDFGRMLRRLADEYDLATRQADRLHVAISVTSYTAGVLRAVAPRRNTSKTTEQEG